MPIKQTITTERKPILIWSDEIEDAALQQARNAANHPLTYDHVALMPDVHSGYSVPIGCVWAIEPDAISPAAIGYDIGCGMCFVETDILVDEVGHETLQKIANAMRVAIPAGMGSRSGGGSERLLPPMPDGYSRKDLPIVDQEWQSAIMQAGSLGSGNHFAQVHRTDRGTLSLMLHSGSRNVGHTVATHYLKLAKKYDQRYGPDIRKWDLSVLPLDEEDGRAYHREMNWCLGFALVNRQIMLDQMMKIVKRHVHCTFSEVLNMNHNLAVLETHGDAQVMVHRKGATSAKKDELGIIPGSQGTKSYIVRGLGNEASFVSSSHGAGRVMSRSAAKKKFDLETERRKMDEKGVIHFMSGTDESDDCYKSVEEVMANQADLVSVEIELTPLVALKGD